MADVMPAEEVPTWDGDPSGFEAFATSCRWYEASLKDNERKLAAPRIWQRLAGAAKSVVRHLDPKNFGTEAGVRPAVTQTEGKHAALDNTGFFENELRGYRLLKAAKLSAAERQHVMTLAKNSAHFQLIPEH